METAIAERQSTASPSGWAERAVGVLFDRFAAIYGTEKFAGMWRGQKLADVRAVWATEVASLTREEMQRGAAALRDQHPSWPPTLFEFLDLCRPAPRAVTPEAAFYEAVRGLEQRKLGNHGTWSHRAIYWAAMDVTPFDVLGLAWPQIRARWTRALEIRLTDPNLAEIPEPPKRLAPPEPLSRDEAAERFAAIKAQLAERARAQ